MSERLLNRPFELVIKKIKNANNASEVTARSPTFNCAHRFFSWVGISV
jgi:hypothetical protein